MSNLLPFILPLFILLLRLAASWRLNKAGDLISTDQWFHKNVVREIRENQHKIPERIRGYETPILSYPWLFHWVISFFSPGDENRVASYISALIDSLLFVFVLLNMHFVQAENPYPHPSPQLTLFAFGIFLTTPILNRNKLGKFLIRSRAFGMILVTVSMSSFSFFSKTGDPIWLLVSSIFGALVFVASKFGIQAFIGIFFLTGLLLENLMVVAIPLLSFGLSLLFFRLWPLKLLLSQMAHLRLYWTTLLPAWPSVRERGQLRKGLGELFKGNLTSSISIFSNNPLVLLVTQTPLLLYLVFLPYTDPSFYHKYQFLLAWLIACVVLFGATSLGKLKVFGQAERYLEYGIVPYTFLGSLILFEEPSYIRVGLLIFGFIFSLVNYFEVFYRKSRVTESNSGGEEGVKWLKSLPEAKRVLPIPLNWSHYLIHHTDHICLSTGFVGLLQFLERRNLEDEFKKRYSIYPFPKTPLHPLLHQEEIDYVWIKGNSSDYVNEELLKSVFKHGDIEIFEVNKRTS